MNGLRIAPIIRRVISAGSIFSLECTLATRTWSRASISSVWSRPPSSRMSTSMPLSRVKEPPRWSLTASTTSSCRASRSALRPWATREPGRVVGEDEVLVAELDRGERHLLDGRAAVGPVRVGVQVATERGPQLPAARRQRPDVGGLELRQPLGDLPAHRSRDHLPRARADAGQLGEAVLGHQSGDLVGRQRQDRRGGLAEGLHLEGVLAAPLQQEGDPSERGDGTQHRPVLAHGPIMPKGGADERRGSARPRDTCLPLASVERRGPEPRRGRR